MMYLANPSHSGSHRTRKCSDGFGYMSAGDSSYSNQIVKFCRCQTSISFSLLAAFVSLLLNGENGKLKLCQRSRSDGE